MTEVPMNAALNQLADSVYRDVARERRFGTADEARACAFNDGVDEALGSVEKLVHEYVERLAGLRQRAGDKQRDTYVVALGQLRAVGLIDESTWREALDRPRIEG